MSIRRASIVLLLALGLAAAPAVAAAKTAPVRWLVKTNDLALLQAQATYDGVTLPGFTWEGCGGLSDPGKCAKGQDPIYTSYWSVEYKARQHYAGVVIFDIETWSYTPAAQRADPLKWICRAARLEQTDKRLRIIITPYSRSRSTMIAEDAEAARCGAYAVDIQSQFANGHPYTEFRPFVDSAVRAIRKASRKVIILAGLATNNPVVQKATALVSDYRYALKAGVQGFWLNANNWNTAGKNRCQPPELGPAPIDGGFGCPQIGIEFLEDIGLIQPAQ